MPKPKKCQSAAGQGVPAHFLKEPAVRRNGKRAGIFAVPHSAVGAVFFAMAQC